MLSLSLTIFTGRAQTGCPVVGGFNGLNGLPSAGVQNGANVTIEVVGSALQQSDLLIEGAASNWMTNIPGATYKFATQDVSSVPSGNASASNPVIIFQIGPASDFAQGAPCAGGFMCAMPPSLDANNHVVVGQIELNPAFAPDNPGFQRGFDHELGHEAFGLADCNNCDNAVTIMATPETTTVDPGPTPCDQGYVFNESGGAYGTNPNPGGDPPAGCSTVPLAGGPVGELSCNGGGPGSPVILDAEGEGFHLTSAATGVKFDISGTGHPVQIAWTDPHFHNAFLALPGPDGLVHNGKELFGNFTPQPLTNDPNGFLALAEFDKPENGGNGDGIIDESDGVYSRLRLWIDENHDGISQPNELHPLTELGVYSLALNYTQSRRTDAFGNQFRFKARVNPGERHDFRDERQHGEDNEVGRWAYDVFFVTAGK
jgi:hypothetical protein